MSVTEKSKGVDAEPEVLLVEPEPEPLEPHVYEHPLLDVDYQHAPATAGLDYPLPGADTGVLVDEVAEPKKKAAAKSS